MSKIFNIWGRRGHVLNQAFQEAKIETSYQEKIYGPRRLWGVLYEIFIQLRKKWDSYDYVIVDSVEYILLGYIISILIKKPLIFRLRGDFKEEIKGKINIKNALDQIANEIFKFAIKRCHKVVTVSNYLAKRLEKQQLHLKGEIETIPVSVKEFSCIENTSKNKKIVIIGSVTNFRFKKKVSTIIRYMPAISAVMQCYPNIVFIIAGDGPERKPFIKTIKRKFPEIADRIIAPGHINDMRKFYHKAKLILYISGLDAFPRAILEAQIAGKVVIANVVGGIPEMINHGVTGYLIKNKHQLAKTIALNLNENQLLKKIGVSAKINAINKYSPIVIGRMWKQMLNLEN